MKNSLFSIFLFILLLGFLTYTDISFKNLCTDVINMCDEMEKSIDYSTKEKSFEDAMAIFNLIQDKGSIASIYINHMDYDVMLNEALKLTVYIEKDDSSETEASLHLLKYSTEHMKELQVPNIQNIF
ncbi:MULTISPECIES: DUF4363 family protein [unclassified Clostridium]|uniref:DUF4363 family protein n=1 Tax=unclassified Clostridium TaxID=2614128 RepID=UPI001C8C27C0|nr:MULTISPECIES: DUF4363 family protein [unclassified Clostridium]MBX9137252.1 DUF4363 family protein [Clostridium sp. K12(2020)]MBX9144063.1 DUF4363 family protein [Clostridium sp. K13]